MAHENQIKSIPTVYYTTRCGYKQRQFGQINSLFDRRGERTVTVFLNIESICAVHACDMLILYLSCSQLGLVQFLALVIRQLRYCALLDTNYQT